MIKNYILVFLVTSALAECPSKEVMKPCTCDNDEQLIQCSSATSDELKAMFKRVSANIKDKNFDRLLINMVNSTEITANLTHDLIFQSIQIGSIVLNRKLMRIHSNAFAGTASQVKNLDIQNQFNLISSSAPYNIFDLINSMVNLKRINIIGTGIADIPANAFKNLAKLKRLYITGLKKTSKTKQMLIGEKAFYNLENLQSLDLSNNRINKLSANSLRFQNNNSSLGISLSGNNLNSTSFELRSLEQFNRLTQLELKNNQIEYLDRQVFSPFFMANNRNVIYDLSDNPLNCSNCHNAWLVKEIAKSRVSYAYCDEKMNGKTIFEVKFDHCKSGTLF